MMASVRALMEAVGFKLAMGGGLLVSLSDHKGNR